MKKISLIVIASIALTVLQAAVAQATFSADEDAATMGYREREASYEPFINGGVSANGLYPSQIAEDKSFATLGRLAQ